MKRQLIWAVHAALTALRPTCLLPALLPVAAAQAASVCPPAIVAPDAQHLEALRLSAQDHGFLWSVDKDGRRSWLYGTMHVAKEAWSVPGPVVMRALNESDGVALEMDVNDPATQAELGRLAREGAGQIPDALRPRVARLLSQVCLPEAAMDRLHPAMLFAAIELLGLRTKGLESAYGLDGTISAIAHRSGLTVRALETPREQIVALRGERSTVAPRQLKESLAMMESGRGGAPTQRLVRAWAQSDIGALDTYLQWCDCQRTAAERAEVKRLLDDRNPAMAKSIDRMLKQGGTLFAAVGALHMAGPHGLPELLRQRGYAVRAVPLRSAAGKNRANEIQRSSLQDAVAVP